MARKQAETEFAWARFKIQREIHGLAIYIRDRFGLETIPIAYVGLLSYAYAGKDYETVAQEMAASIGITLPPLSEENLQLELEKPDGTIDTTE